MRLVKRAAITVTPKQPYIDWANAIDEDGVKIGEEFWPEKHIYLIEDISDTPFDREAIARSYFETIFKEELNGWYRLESAWPSPRTFGVFLEWFEVEIHSMVLDMRGGWLIRTEGYERY